jgi:hypothetical protein
MMRPPCQDDNGDLVFLFALPTAQSAAAHMELLSLVAGVIHASTISITPSPRGPARRKALAQEIAEKAYLSGLFHPQLMTSAELRLAEIVEDELTKVGL